MFADVPEPTDAHVSATATDASWWYVRVAATILQYDGRGTGADGHERNAHDATRKGNS